jgi:hypothetical protein
VNIKVIKVDMTTDTNEKYVSSLKSHSRERCRKSRAKKGNRKWESIEFTTDVEMLLECLCVGGC